MSRQISTLPAITSIDGIGVDEDGWIISLQTEGGLFLPLLFPHDQLLVLLDYLRRAKEARGWTEPENPPPRRRQVPRQPPIRVQKTEGVSLGSDDDGAEIGLQTGINETTQLFLPKSQVVRLIALLEFQARRKGWADRPSEQCDYISEEDRCRNRVASGNFCSRHARLFDGRSNRDLLEAAASFFRILNGASKDASPQKVKRIAIAELANCVSALQYRGYEQKDLERALKLSLGEPLMGDDSSARVAPRWRRFERLTFGIYLLRAEGARVSFDEKFVGRLTGRPRQVDIAVRFKRLYSEFLLMVECKDERVSIDQIEALNTKRQDVGANHVIVVSSSGYQEGAIQAAKSHGIDLHELTEERVDWTSTLRRKLYEVPFARHVEFDSPPFAGTASSPPIGPVKFADIVFHNSEDRDAFTLAEILHDVTVWAHGREIQLPCEIRLRFEGTVVFQPPGRQILTPVYGLSITLERWKVTTSSAIDLPPHVVNYRYGNASLGTVDLIDPHAVDEALQQNAEGRDSCKSSE